MGIRSSVDKRLIPDPSIEDEDVRENIFIPEDQEDGIVTQNYLDESNRYVARKNSSENPY